MARTYFFTDLIHSIRFKILASLFVVLAASIAVALYGFWTYERDQFIEVAHKEAMRAGRTIEKALRASMLQNNKEAIQKTITEISSIVEPPSQISIVAGNGRVVFSNATGLVGRVLDRHKEQGCIICHTTKRTNPSQKAIIIETSAGPFLRNVIKITNDPACYACHSADRKILGILLYDSFLLHTYDLLRTVALRIFLTGLFTFLVVIAVLAHVTNKFIQQPIAALQNGFLEVGRGNYTHWVEVERSGGEFADMADSFNIMARAIDRFVKEIKSKNSEISTLYTVVQQISKTIDWFQLKKIVLDLLGEVFGTGKSSLIIPIEKKEKCFEISWRNTDDRRLNHIQYLLGSPDFSAPSIKKEELDSWLREKLVAPKYLDNETRVLIPLRHKDVQLGLIGITKTTGKAFTDSEKTFIPALANHLAISIANARLYHLAITDGLTDLFSKRYFLDTINRLVKACRKQPEKSFCMMMLDLDKFKQINDTYGHPAGDQVLVQLADIMRENIRFGDIPCRYGGEEFAVLLPDIKDDRQIEEDIAVRLCKMVADHVFICDGCPPIRMTISIGVANFPLHASTAAELIQAADAMLYEAKEGGRNQVRIKS